MAYRSNVVVFYDVLILDKSYSVFSGKSNNRYVNAIF